jgi:plasmid replication initiation protein
MRDCDNFSLVVKSNTLVEACYRLTMVEQQLLLMAIVEARVAAIDFTDLPKKGITIRAADFVAMFGTDSKSAYHQIKSAIDILFERHLTTHDIDPTTGFPRINKFRWISKASYVDGAGNVSIIFTDDVIPYFTNLEEQFTAYRIQQIGNLSSVHAIRIYEFLLRFKSTGVRFFEVQKLRDTLGLIDEYPLFANLKAKVLDVAVEQINEHTDLKISYKTRKTGRRITHLDFSIKEKSSIVSKRPKLDKAYIDANALTGETYEQARIRLANLRDAKK